MDSWANNIIDLLSDALYIASRPVRWLLCKHMLLNTKRLSGVITLVGDGVY